MEPSRWSHLNPWRGLRALPREVWVLAWATMVNRAGTMVLPFLTLYLTGALGLEPSFAGVCLGLYGAASLVAAPLGGWLADRGGARPVMIASLVLTAAILFAFPLARSASGLVVAVLALSLASEVFRPASLAMVAVRTLPAQRKAAFALLRLAINLGMSVGPALGGSLVAVSFTALFWVDGSTCLLAAAVLALAVRRRGTAGPDRDPAASTPARTGYRDRRLLFLLAATVPIGIVFFQHVVTMPLFLVRDLGLSEAVYGLMFTINTILIVLLEVPINLATAEWPHRRTLAIGCFLVGAGFGAMAVANSAWGIAVTVVVWTFGEMMLLPGMTSYVSDIAPPGKSGEYMGLYTMTFGIAFVAGPLLGTAIYERLGGESLWAIMFVLGLASTGMLATVPAATGTDSREEPS